MSIQKFVIHFFFLSNLLNFVFQVLNIFVSVISIDLGQILQFSVFLLIFCRILSSHSGGYGAFYLLGYNAMYSVESQPAWNYIPKDRTLLSTLIKQIIHDCVTKFLIFEPRDSTLLVQNLT
jgi:hypothetical protein